MNTLKSEELVNEFSIFAFNQDRKEVMSNVAQTICAPKGVETSKELIVTRNFLVDKFVEFINFKEIQHNIAEEISVLKEENKPSISYVVKTYSISYKRAQKIVELYNSLI
jgi:hypothetical protein